MQRSLNVGSDRLPVLTLTNVSVSQVVGGKLPIRQKLLKIFALKIRKFVRTFYETYDAYLIYMPTSTYVAILSIRFCNVRINDT